MTALVAVLIALLSQIGGLRDLFLHFPELLIVQIACIVAIAEFFDLRLLASLNPPAVKKRFSPRAQKARFAVEKVVRKSRLEECAAPELVESF